MLFWNRWNQESACRVYFNIQPLSCKLEWINQKHFYCFFNLLKPIRDKMLQGSREFLISLLYMRKRALGRDWRVHLNMAALLREVILHFIFYLFIYLFNECGDLSVFLSDFKMSSYFLSLEQKYRLISSVENKAIASEQILVIILAL